jgi:hypothetical protein
MTPRQKELSQFTELSWLAVDAAGSDFSVAIKATSDEHYGLNEHIWEIVERWDIEFVGEEETRSRLAAHVLDSEVVVFFGPQDVCRMSRETFLMHWQDMFMPSRDDVVIMPTSSAWCLFYCHEDEFEVGRRKKPNKALDMVEAHL